MTITLRPEQRRSVDNILRLWNRRWFKHKHLLGIANTGKGKTIMFLSAVTEDNPGRVLALAHTNEIVRSWDSKAREHYVNCFDSFGILNGQRKNYKGQFTVASWQTMSNPKVLIHYLSHGRPTHVVFDEAHRWLAPTPMGLAKRLQSLPGVKSLGITATFRRLDRRPLGNLFSRVAFELMSETNLAPVIMKKLPFQSYDGVVYDWLLFNPHRYKTLIFCNTRWEAVYVANHFHLNGVSAGAITSDSNAMTRQIVLDGSDVICNVGVYTEGADLSDIGCVIDLTSSPHQTNFIQKVGRGRRPDTDRLIVLAYGQTHNLVMRGNPLKG